MKFGALLRTCLVVPALTAGIICVWAWTSLVARSPLFTSAITIALGCGLIEVMAVTLAVSRLVRAPSLRTSSNVLCTAVGAVPALILVTLYWKSLY